jgi:streptogramin lyase
MKRFGLFVVLVLCLVSCGPIASSSTIASTVKAQVTATSILSPTPWPGLQDGWMRFSRDLDGGVLPVYDSTGYFWANGDNGLLRWNITTGELNIIPYPTDLSPGGRLVAFDKKVWLVNTGNGEVAYYSSGRWIKGPNIPYKSGTPINSYTYQRSSYTLAEAGGRLWLLSVYGDYSNCPTSAITNACTQWYKGFYYFDGQTWQTFTPIPQITDAGYYSIVKAKDGSFWFANYTHIWQYKNDTWLEYKNLRGARMFALADDTLLFVFDTLIMTFDGESLSILVFPGERFYYPIERSYLTPKGDLFIRLRNNYGDAKVETYLIHNGQVMESPDLKFENVPNDGISLDYPFTTPRGWILRIPNGFYLYDGKNWKEFKKPNSTPIYQAMGGSPLGFAADGSLWSIDDKGIKKFDGRKNEYVYKGNLCFPNLPSDAPLSNLEYRVSYRMDAKGNIWGMAPANNLLCYFDAVKKEASVFEVAFNTGNFSLFPTPFPHFTGKGFALAPNGSVWATSPDGYIANFTLDFLKKDSYRQVEKIKIGGDLVNYPLNPLRIEVGSDGAVWVFAENSGLYRYDGKDWKYYGLSNLQEVSAFTIDKQGQVWAGYPDLLLKYDGVTWVKYPIEKDFNYKIYPSNMAVSPDGAIWFANNSEFIGSKAVYKFDGNKWLYVPEIYSHSDTSFVEQILFAPDGAVWFMNYSNWARYKPK